MLRRKNRMTNGRIKTRYDLQDNSVESQARDLVWLYNPRRSNSCCPKLSSDWEGRCIVVMTINDVIYRTRRELNRKMKIVHLDRLMKSVDIFDRDDQN